MCQLNNTPSVLTLVASDEKISANTVDQVTALIVQSHIPVIKTTWLSPDRAIDLYLDTNVENTQAVTKEILEITDASRIDLFISPAKNRRKKLLVADMDSTIVQGETLDELSKYLGVDDKVSEITGQAMRGELDFEQALNARLRLLVGLSSSVITDAVSHMQYSKHAKTFIETMKAHGAYCYLVSGGFTQFTLKAFEDLSFDGHHGNIFEIKEGALTGSYVPPLQTKDSKVEHLNHYLNQHNIAPHDVLCIGDGANDIPMLKQAETSGGLGIAYHGKLKVAQAVTNAIRYGTLRAALYAQGYNDQDIATSE